MRFTSKEWDAIKAAAALLDLRPETFVKLSVSVMVDVLVRDPVAFKLAALQAVDPVAFKLAALQAVGVSSLPTPKPKETRTRHKESTVTLSLGAKLRAAGLANDDK